VLYRTGVEIRVTRCGWTIFARLIGLGRYTSYIARSLKSAMAI
jgi:hypothetical protein